MEPNTKETFSKTKSMAEERWSSAMGKCMKETFAMAKCMDKESLEIDTIKSYMTDSGAPTKNMGTVQRTMGRAHTTTVSFITTENMEMVRIKILWGQFIKENGLMIK